MIVQTPPMCVLHRTAFTVFGLMIGAFVLPAEAEIVPAQCRLIRYGGMETPVESFPCDFRQSGGNVQVWSQRWNFDFPYSQRDKSYIRINGTPLKFTRTGQYTLEVRQ